MQRRSIDGRLHRAKDRLPDLPHREPRAPRLGAGIIDGICFFQPTALAEGDGDWCRSPDFELVTGARIAGCRNVMRRSQAWEREYGRERAEETPVVHGPDPPRVAYLLTCGQLARGFAE